MLTPDLDENHVTTILRSTGWNGHALSLRALTGGANNRVFLLESDQEPLVVKLYYKNPNDERNRLAAEYNFLTYAFSRGIANVPQPVACDAGNGLGIYSFINGNPLTRTDIGIDEVLEAADFFRKLNRGRTESVEADNLPNASEACFSIRQHCDLISARIKRLENIEKGTGINAIALEFVSRLKKKWEIVQAEIQTQSKTMGMPYDDELPPDLRCISPSDFGFHNALRTDEGRISFLDFEYAGWDDPGKMGADFFSQPAVPVPEDHMEIFLETALRDFRDRDFLIDRVKLLLPVYRIKWCCIVLNEFLPDSASRRFFSNGSKEQQRQKEIQLEKAEKILKNLTFPLL